MWPWCLMFQFHSSMLYILLTMVRLSSKGAQLCGVLVEVLSSAHQAFIVEMTTR